MGRRVEVSWPEVAREARERFGVKHFRPGQREVIEAVLGGRDVLAIMPTGAGKSLCFQLPALFIPGPTIVVSPLLALVQDQLERAEDAEVSAARLDSTLTAREARQEEHAVSRGHREFVYVTPERLQKEDQLELLARSSPSLFVVDEAHCVSQWGHDFRPAYLGLRHAIEALGRPTVLALTATAPPHVAADVLEHLGLWDATTVSTGVERPNLFFRVSRCVNRTAKEQRLLTLVRETGGPGIVYVATVRRGEELYRWLRAEGIDAARYHGKLPKREREETQARFMSGTIPVVVATNAFGLGIDKADIRFVVHWNFPDSVEAYYQEAGRAGRDGAPATAELLYRLEDKRIRSFFLGGKHPRRADLAAVDDALRAAEKGAAGAELARTTGLPAKRVQVILARLEAIGIAARRGRNYVRARDFESPEERERFLSGSDERSRADRERLEAIMRYAEEPRCRMQAFREYFGEDPGEPCDHCDTCESGIAHERHQFLRARSDRERAAGAAEQASDAP
jgi:ATP-dependent DNA helicase RecQ